MIFGFFLQNMRHRLGDSEIAGGHQHQHAIFRAPEGRHFAKRIDLIDAGAGPGVGQHDKTGVDQEADAISQGARFYTEAKVSCDGQAVR